MTSERQAEAKRMLARGRSDLEIERMIFPLLTEVTRCRNVFVGQMLPEIVAMALANVR